MIKTFLPKIYEIMLKKMVEPDGPQMTIRSMRFACWITTATNIHSEYVTLIAFVRQQRSCERACMLRYTYIACLIYTMR
jgi:hypothetical protein